jgi:hypothetical protein
MSEARALRCAGGEGTECTKQKSRQIDQHRRRGLFRAGSSTYYAGPGGAGSDKQFGHDQVHFH